jgi:hypothetical protein
MKERLGVIGIGLLLGLDEGGCGDRPRRGSHGCGLRTEAGPEFQID